jgi:hypothetical protein
MGERFEGTFNGVRSALKKAVSGQFGAEEVTWTVIEAVAAALDGTVFPIFSAGAAVGQAVYERVTVAGSAAQVVTVVDAGPMGVHANALSSTGLHLYKLKAIADGYKETRTIRTGSASP